MLIHNQSKMVSRNPTSTSLLLTFFCLLLSVASSQVLPGVDNRPVSYNGVCMEESNALLSKDEIRNELSRLHSEVAQVDTEGLCALLDAPNIVGERYECELDFVQLGVGFKSACLRNGGNFEERNVRVHCLGGDGSDATTPAPAYSWEFTNYPLCSGADCTVADTDRLLARSLIQTETALQYHLNHAVCKADPNDEFRGGYIHSWINDERDEILGQIDSETTGNASSEEGSDNDSEESSSRMGASFAPAVGTIMTALGYAMLA